jgi:D-alanine-D-alanine ligase
MTEKRVKIIYNDDGTDEYVMGDKRIQFDAHSKTVAEIEGALAAAGYSTSVAALVDAEDHVGSLENFLRELRDAEGAMIFNLCEAAFDSSAYEMHITALLEIYGLSFTGSGPFTLALALDKGMSKDVLKSRGVTTPAYAVFDSVPVALGGLSFPLIVKPLREDASVGIDSGSVVHSPGQLEARVEYVIANYGQPAIAEQYIEGREINVAIIGNGSTRRALPPSEISFAGFPEDLPKICCYEAKWVTESRLYQKTVPVCPAEVSEALRAELVEVALKAYDVMGCRDYARVDTRVGEDGRVYVIEVNPNPDLSSDAGLARAARAAGLDYAGLVAEIVRVAEERCAEEEEAELPSDLPVEADESRQALSPGEG